MISVCIAAYNGEKYIKEQLTSILCQIGNGDEVIISDDGSTDNTRSIIMAMGDPRILLIEGPNKKSPFRNFEHALTVAKGDIIFTSDQDDVWHWKKVETMCRYLQDADCIVSDCRVTDANLNITSESFYAINHTRQGKWYNLLIHNGYLGCCMAFRRHVLDTALPFPPQIPQHDIWIGNVAAFKYHLTFINEKLIDYRRHDSNASTTSGKSDSTLAQKWKYRWPVIKGLYHLLRLF